MKPVQVVTWLLESEAWLQQALGEASVHLPRRGRVYVASYTGLTGQEWKSTGTSDYAAALGIARALEAAARAQRAQSGSAVKKQRLRHRQLSGSLGGGLTQREVGLLMGISERGVRAIEKRALQKLAQHPELARLWREYQTGELTEQGHLLSADEIQALVGLTRNQAELNALLKVLEIVQT